MRQIQLAFFDVDAMIFNVHFSLFDKSFKRTWHYYATKDQFNKINQRSNESKKV